MWNVDASFLLTRLLFIFLSSSNEGCPVGILSFLFVCMPRDFLGKNAADSTCGRHGWLEFQSIIYSVLITCTIDDLTRIAHGSGCA